MLNKKNFDLVKFVNKWSGTYAYDHILVAPNETVATNGHALVRIGGAKPNDEKPDGRVNPPEGMAISEKFEPFTMNPEIAQRIANALPTPDGTKRFESADIAIDTKTDEPLAPKLVYVKDKDGVTMLKNYPAKNKFANWQAVIPAEEPLATVILNAQFLRDLAVLAMKFGGPHQAACMKLSVYGPMQAMRVDVTNELTQQGLTALLMPIAPHNDLFAKLCLPKRQKPKVELVGKPEIVKKDSGEEGGATDGNVNQDAGKTENGGTEETKSEGGTNEEKLT